MAVFLKNTGRVTLKRQVRRVAVMSAFREAETPLSIADVTQKTGFNFPIVSSIIHELVEQKLIYRIDQTASTGGRPSALFRLKADSKYAIGVSVDRKYAVFLAVDMANNVIAEKTMHSHHIKPTKSGWDRLLTQTKSFVEESGIAKGRITGAGFGFGIGAEKSILNDTNVEQAFQRRAQEVLGFSTRIENDAKLMILAEKRYGIAKKHKNAICVMLGWGIGMGTIINDQIYFGANRNAGELGHIVIDEKGPLCYCGKRGCLESYASGQAVVKSAVKKLKAGAQSFLRDYSDGDFERIDEDIIIKAALNGDIFSIELIESVGKTLGREISNLVKLFDPEVVIVTGTMAEAGKFLLTPIQAMVDKLDLYYRTTHVQVIQSNLGHRAVALGAASFLLDKYFYEPSLDPSRFV